MIINDDFAPLTEAVSELYWRDDVNGARINRIVQFILERDAARPHMHLTSGILRDLLASLTPEQLSALRQLFTPPTGK